MYCGVLISELRDLVPRLCLGTHCLAGSACREVALTHRVQRGRASRAVRSQAEPGNEKNEKRMDRSFFVSNNSKKSGPFDIKTVESLIALMAQHDLNEIYLREGSQHVRLRRGATTAAGAPVAAVP